MNEQELREQIAEVIARRHEVSSQTEIRDLYFSRADQILSIIKEAGYVKLADNQSLPLENSKCLLWDLYQQGWLEAQRCMRIAGWRKIEIENGNNSC